MWQRLAPNLEVIPGYKLIRYLGHGGFGEVWQAEAPGGLLKAVKLAPMDGGPESLNSRELEGLQKIRSIRHPYLLSIERFEIVDGYLVIVMELADKSLADRYEECFLQGKAGIGREELLGYMREAAEVLDLMSNQHGLQHLDIKPENLFLSGGHVKVADFGLVQPRNSSLNRSMLAISPPYAAPELFDGRVEPTADQYSLAVTYQELLTGTRPFDAPDVRQLILQHLQGWAELSSLPPPDRPPVARAISIEPDKRFASCRAFVEALARAAAFGTPLAIPVPLGKPDTPTTLSPFAQRREAARTAAQLHAAALGYTRAPVGKVETVTLRGSTVRISEAGVVEAAEANQAAGSNRLETSFIAFLPMQIFACKLRGFLESLEAEIVHCNDDRAVLWLGIRGWFGGRKNGFYIGLDTYARDRHSGYRVVNGAVWSADNIPREVFARKAMLLLHMLKAYLLAIDQPIHRLYADEKRLRAEVLG